MRLEPCIVCDHALPLAGGPLLHRTPPPASVQRRVDAADASLQRVVLYSAARVPASSAVAALRRSPGPARSLPRSAQRSPERAAPDASATPAAYPVPEGDTSTLQRIPGGPKILRTPVGGRAGAGVSPAPGSAPRRVRPGSRQGTATSTQSKRADLQGCYVSPVAIMHACLLVHPKQAHGCGRRAFVAAAPRHWCNQLLQPATGGATSALCLLRRR